MAADSKTPAWDALSYAEKNKELLERQKRLLNTFLERGVISRKQYEKSLYDLIAKMKTED